jgi:hypothetical protein
VVTRIALIDDSNIRPDEAFDEVFDTYSNR